MKPIVAENAVTVKRLSRLGKSFSCQYLFISLYLLFYIQTLIRSCQIPAIYNNYSLNWRERKVGPTFLQVSIHIHACYPSQQTKEKSLNA